MATQQQNPSSQFGFRPLPSQTAAGASGVSLRGDVQYVAPMQLLSATTEATAGDVTHTADEVLGGLILRDCNGGARTDTFPTAALLVAAYKGVVVGSGVRVIIRNTSDAAEAITMVAGTGMAILAGGGDLLSIAQNATSEYLIQFTNVTSGSEACVLYTINSGLHTTAGG